MLFRILLLLILLTVFFISGLFLQDQHGFYFLKAESWSWAYNYWKAYGEFPSFLEKQLFINFIIVIACYPILIMLLSRINPKTLFGKYEANKIHGSSKWASWEDIQNASLASGKGVVVGGYEKNKTNKLIPLTHDGAEHILCFAPTRSGKGVGLVLPTLLSWEGNTLVLDIKGENYEKTSGYRKATLGQKIFRFDPTSTEGGSRFNPLAEIRLGTDFEIKDVQNIAMMLISPKEKNSLTFWEENGFHWLTAGLLFSLYFIKLHEDRIASLNDVAKIMSQPKTIANMITFNPEWEQEPRPDVKDLINNMAQSMEAKADGEKSGICSSAMTSLGLYQDPIIARNVATSDFKAEDLISLDGISLYIVVPPSDIERLKPLLRLIINIIIDRLTTKLPTDKFKRLLLMLDEFTSIGRLDSFETSLAYMAGYGLKSYIIVQDLAQLQKIYGKNESIISNCHIRIAYAPNRIETAEILSKMAGKTTIVQEKKSARKNVTDIISDVTTSINEVARPLLTPDECMQLAGAVKDKKNPNKIIKGGAMLIFPAGFSPILGKQILYFQNKELLERSLFPPADQIKAIAKTSKTHDLLICDDLQVPDLPEEQAEYSALENEIYSSLMEATKGETA